LPIFFIFCKNYNLLYKKIFFYITNPMKTMVNDKK